MFGSCEGVNDDTDNDSDDTKAREHHPAYIILVLKVVLLPVPLIPRAFSLFSYGSRQMTLCKSHVYGLFYIDIMVLFFILHYCTALVSSPWFHCSLIKYLHFWVEIANYPIIKYESLIISELYRTKSGTKHNIFYRPHHISTLHYIDH